MKWLVKLFIPKPAKIAKIAADAIAKAINESDKGELIAK